MRDILKKKTKITFALKVSLLFSLLLFASVLKQRKESDKETENFARNVAFEIPITSFTIL